MESKNELYNFIIQLESQSEDSQLRKFIPKYAEFIESLKKLNSMIGMCDIKKNIISQIKYYLINKNRKIDNLNKKEYFHTVLLGPPGSGKTTVAENLADIWINLGILDYKKDGKDIDKLDETKIIKSDIYTKLKEEKDTLAKNNIKITSKLIDQTSRFYTMKDDIFYIKNHVKIIQSFVETYNTNPIPEEFKTETLKMISPLDVFMDAMLKNNYTSHMGHEIEPVEEKDYQCNDFLLRLENSLLEDESESSEEDLVEEPVSKDVKITFTKINPFEIGNLFSNNLMKLSEKEPVQDVGKVLKLRRDDLVGKFVGHTAIKTREALNKGLGKVIFLDEAYELYNSSASDSGDAFGMECLNTILHFINENSDKCIIIFAGYEDLLKKTIFKVQPGLERRIGWTFNISPYNPSELLNIYISQLKENSWSIYEKDKSKILDLFKKNSSLFKNGGGDTLRLTMYTKTVHSDLSFEKLLSNEEIPQDITFEIVKKALEILKANIDVQREKDIGYLNFYT